MNSDPGADSDNELRIVANDDVGVERYIQLLANGLNQARVAALRADGGARFDLELFTTSGSVEIWTDGVQRWTFGAGSGGFDFEIEPFITNRYDIGNTVKAVRDVFTNRVFLGQDQIASYDAITIDATDLTGDGQQDSGAVIWTGKGFETATPHDIDWKAFVNVTADDGTGSIFTIQARIDGASFVDEFTITATTSPTLAAIGPGSTGGALAFGPSASAAQAGTIRFQFTDDVRYRNEGDDGDLIALSFGESSKMILGESGIPFIDVQAQFIVNNEFSSNFDGTTAFAIRSTTRTIFAVDTTNNDIEIVDNVERLASVVDRFKMLGRPLSVNSTVGFSGAMLLEGQAREAGGSLHDATWRMYVEPLTTTAFDGQSVFKITAEIDTGGPTTVFTLSDTGDLIVPGSFTIDGLIIDVTSTEAFLVRKNADAGDVFTVNTSGDLVTLGPSTDLLWSAEDGNIGASSATRPANVHVKSTVVIGDDETAGYGLTIGDNSQGHSPLWIVGSFTSDGAQGFSAASAWNMNLTGFAGDTVLAGLHVNNTITTQGNTDVIANVASLFLAEPQITVGAGDTITNAQTLLITGAPTEGASNYALRILGGDLQVAASSAFLFRNNSNSGDLTALANAPTDFLEIGGVGAGEWERVNVYSLGSIRFLPTDDVQVRTDNSSAFRVSDASNVLLFVVQQTQTRVIGSLVVADSIANNSAETEIQSTFADVATSAGSSVTAASLIPAGSFVIGVTVRVIGTVLGPASFDVGDGTDVDRWGASIAISQLTTTDITDYTTGAVTTFPLANDVVLTSTGVDFTGGSVRITVHYMTLQTSAA